MVHATVFSIGTLTHHTGRPIRPFFGPTLLFEETGVNCSADRRLMSFTAPSLVWRAGELPLRLGPAPPDDSAVFEV